MYQFYILLTARKCCPIGGDSHSPFSDSKGSSKMAGLLRDNEIWRYVLTQSSFFYFLQIREDSEPHILGLTTGFYFFCKNLWSILRCGARDNDLTHRFRILLNMQKVKKGFESTHISRFHCLADLPSCLTPSSQWMASGSRHLWGNTFWLWVIWKIGT
jgi:hypothetical protein